MTGGSMVRSEARVRGAMLKYTLPALAYDYSALEPHYSARLLERHHGKHHAGHVTGANETLEKLGGGAGRDRLRGHQPALEEPGVPP
jgi:Iron/manganese superoxide dismutases, alpha-hairpin domain